MIIQQRTKLPQRIGVLLLFCLPAAVGIPGAGHTFDFWNAQKEAEIRHERMADAEVATLKAEQELAESYAELQLKQATCSQTLEGFYYSPDRPLIEQLNAWGIDWGSRVWNTNQWQPIFDSANQLVGAIRLDPASGDMSVVSIADEPQLNQAAMCNFNQLTE